MQVERSLVARLAALVATVCVLGASATPAFAVWDTSKRPTGESPDYLVVTMEQAFITH